MKIKLKSFLKNDKSIYFSKHKRLKYFIPIVSFFLLLFVFLAFRIVPAMLANDVYSIGDLNDKLDKVKEGDIINYEINGYSKWRVLGVDKENGTVEVTSDSNVYDLTLEPNKTADEYRAIFQAEADKFSNDEYVVNSRTIAKSDSLRFDTKGEYWLANVNEDSLMTNLVGDFDSEKIIYKSFNQEYTVLVWPRADIYQTSSCNKGSNYNISSYDWTCDYSYRTYRNGRYVYHNTYLMVNPMQVNVNGDNYNTVFKDIINSFGFDYDYISFRGYYNLLDDKFNYDRDRLDEYLKTYTANAPIFLFEHAKWFYSSDSDSDAAECKEKKYRYECSGNSLYLMQFNPDGTKNYDFTLGGDRPKTLTFGYRPVLTLKISDDESAGKSTNDQLKIGDNVKYEANGYRNWKVLSINEDAGTVDLISGGIVKNISLYGTDDYNNYETILQNEVDAYRSGDDVVSARPVSSDDVDLLIKMKDSVSAMYWYNLKNIVVRDSGDAYFTNSVSYDNSYEVGLVWTNTGDYYINDVNTNSSPYIRKYWVSLFSSGSDTSYSNNSYYVGTGDLNYIAGLRPIITLKYDAAKKISSVQARKLDTESQTYDLFYASEQSANNSQDPMFRLLYSNDGQPVNNNSLYNGDNSKSKGVCEHKVDLGETADTIHLALVLSIIYGFIVVCFALYVVAYKFKFFERK